MWKKRKKHVFSLKRERQQLWNLFDRVFPKSVYITEKRRSPRRRGFGSAGDKTSKLNETRRERFRPGIPPSPPPSLFLVPDNKARHFLPSSISRFLSHPLPFPFSLSSVRLCVPKQNFLTVCLGRSFLSLLAVSLLDCLCLRVWPGGGEVRRGRSAKYVFTCAKLTGEKT